MKVQLNLANPPDARERYALAWSIPVTLGAILVLVYSSISSVSNVRNYRKYERSLVQLRGQESRWADREKALREELSRPEHQEAFHQVKFVNSLIEQKQFSLAGLMDKVAKLLPPAVHLDGLTFSPKKSSVIRMTVVGRNQEAVENFLSNLEDSDDFRDVVLLNQGLTGKSGSAAEVTVTCSAVYAGEGE